MAVNQFDIVEISARAEFGGVEDVVNVYQMQLTTVSPVADSVAITQLAAFIEGLYGPLISSQSTDYLYRDLTFRNLTTSTIMAITPWPSLIAGSGGAVNNPPGIAGVVNMATNVARVVLRKFIGGLVTAALDPDGTFTAVLQAALVTFGNTLINGTSSGGDVWAYGHLSPKTLQFEIPASAVATDVPGYQRRRKQGRGV